MSGLGTLADPVEAIIPGHARPSGPLSGARSTTPHPLIPRHTDQIYALCGSRRPLPIEQPSHQKRVMKQDPLKPISPCK